MERVTSGMVLECLAGQSRREEEEEKTERESDYKKKI